MRDKRFWVLLNTCSCYLHRLVFRWHLRLLCREPECQSFGYCLDKQTQIRIPMMAYQKWSEVDSSRTKCKQDQRHAARQLALEENAHKALHWVLSYRHCVVAIFSLSLVPIRTRTLRIIHCHLNFDLKLASSKCQYLVSCKTCKLPMYII